MINQDAFIKGFLDKFAELNKQSGIEKSALVEKVIPFAKNLLGGVAKWFSKAAPSSRGAAGNAWSAGKTFKMPNPAMANKGSRIIEAERGAGGVWGQKPPPVKPTTAKPTGVKSPQAQNYNSKPSGASNNAGVKPTQANRSITTSNARMSGGSSPNLPAVMPKATATLPALPTQQGPRFGAGNAGSSERTRVFTRPVGTGGEQSTGQGARRTSRPPQPPPPPPNQQPQMTQLPPAQSQQGQQPWWQNAINKIDDFSNKWGNTLMVGTTLADLFGTIKNRSQEEY